MSEAGDISPIVDPLGYPGTPITVSGELDAAGFRSTPTYLDAPGTLHPVLAIGSNADPAQLRHKFGDDVRLPVTAVRLSGLRIVHSAHVSAPGYLPYTAVLDPGAGPVRALLLWLDDDHLPVLDATEPNYRRLPCPLALMPVAAADQEHLPEPGSYDVYTSRWGPLTERPGGRALLATSQPAAYEALATRSWFSDIVPAWAGTEPGLRVPAAIAALRADPGRRAAVRDLLAAERS